MPEPCRYEKSPGHECTDSFGFEVRENGVCWREARQQLVERDRATLTLSDSEVTALLEVAILNPCRTERQQHHLMQVASRADNFLTSWSGWVAESWEQEPCEACSEPCDIGRMLCDRCRGEHRLRSVPDYEEAQ